MPASLLVATCLALVSMLVRVTWTPAMIAPVGSVIVPPSVPNVVCPRPREQHIKASARIVAICQLSLFIAVHSPTVLTITELCHCQGPRRQFANSGCQRGAYVNG